MKELIPYQLRPLPREDELTLLSWGSSSIICRLLLAAAFRCGWGGQSFANVRKDPKWIHIQWQSAEPARLIPWISRSNL